MPALPPPRCDTVLAKAVSHEQSSQQRLDVWLSRLHSVARGGFADVVKVSTGNETLVLKRLARHVHLDIGCSPGGGSDSKTCAYDCGQLKLEAFELERDILTLIHRKLRALPQEQGYLRRIGQTHLIKLIGSFTTPTYHCLLLSPVAFCNLHELLEAYSHTKDDLVSIGPNRQVSKALVTEWLQSYFPALAATVHCLHSLGIQHKDISPKNILCGQVESGGTLDGTLRLCDFGTAQARNPARAPSIAMYNPTWRCPELGPGEEQPEKDDMYHVGLVFLEIQTVLRGRTLGQLEEFLDLYKASDDEMDASIPIRERNCRQEVVAAWLATLTTQDETGNTAHLIQCLVCDFSPLPE